MIEKYKCFLSKDYEYSRNRQIIHNMYWNAITNIAATDLSALTTPKTYEARWLTLMGLFDTVTIKNIQCLNININND